MPGRRVKDVALNEKQKVFCEYYAACFNATDAAKKAGYSAKTAYSHGQRLLKHVEIQKYLNSIQNQARANRIASADEILEYLSGVIRNSEETTRERTKAAELLGKRYALFEEARENPEAKLDKLCNAIREAVR